MAIRVHHTVQKQAAKLGITLTADEFGVTASKDGQSAHKPNGSLAIAALLGSTPTADVMNSLKSPSKEFKIAAKKEAKKAKAKKARKSSKLKCECGSTDVSSDGDGGFVCETCGETVEGEENNGRSVVKKKYKRAYKPFKGKCGDTLADKITAHVMFKPEGESKFRTDADKLVRFAKANGVWDPEYKGRNNGLVRMSVRNRLQGKLNRKELTAADIKWPA